tara:strand:- start:685 stop:1248 length:564 start_codon:yes stop_codon:yes gene_type:complete
VNERIELADIDVDAVGPESLEIPVIDVGLEVVTQWLPRPEQGERGYDYWILQQQKKHFKLESDLRKVEEELSEGRESYNVVTGKLQNSNPAPSTTRKYNREVRLVEWFLTRQEMARKLLEAEVMRSRIVVHTFQQMAQAWEAEPDGPDMEDALQNLEPYQNEANRLQFVAIALEARIQLHEDTLHLI